MLQNSMCGINMTKGACIFLALVLLSGLSAACGVQLETPTPASSEIKIAPLFQTFAQYLDEKVDLGEPISELRKEGNFEVQYLENCSLIYDSSAPVAQRFQLAPLGKTMNVSQLFVPDPVQHDVGYVIFSEFLPLYEELGARFVGKPLMETRFNLTRNRYELYFENMGFYRSADSSPGDVHLLTYGLWACSENCRRVAQNENARIDDYHGVDVIFETFVNQMGVDFTGYALTEVYIGQSGSPEQVFEQVVLVIDPNVDGGVRLFSLPKALNIPAEDARPNSNRPGFYFYSKDSQLGYEVPAVFWDYLAKYGSLLLSGPPITHLEPLEHGSRQCFENLCLVYDEVLPENARVHPQGLGFVYYNFFGFLRPTPGYTDQHGGY